MARGAAAVAFHFEVEIGEQLREELEKRCNALSDEFPEITRIDITLSEDGAAYAASGHVTGKGTEAAGHASGPEPEVAADQLFDTLRVRLRKIHDKRIFARRREAQRKSPRRTP
jgi:ribosome-associated translation inhibitor RaiA